MAKQILHTITDNGVDGRSPTVTVYASFSEVDRDERFEADKAKAWRSKADVIVDLGLARLQALAKLSVVDRLILGLTP